LKMAKKFYEVNGVIRFAQCFREEVEAKSMKEAKKIVENNIDFMADNMIAEIDDYTIDKPIKLEA
jgi:hypothetical protein